MVVAVLVILVCSSVPVMFQKASVMIPESSSAMPTIAMESWMEGVLNPETRPPAQPPTGQSRPLAHVPVGLQPTLTCLLLISLMNSKPHAPFYSRQQTFEYQPVFFREKLCRSNSQSLYSCVNRYRCVPYDMFTQVYSYICVYTGLFLKVCQ